MVFKVRLLNVVLRIVSVLGGLTLPGLMMTTRQISLKCRPLTPSIILSICTCREII